MSEVANWFERNFEFNFPVELYPNVAVRLRGTPARLEEIARAYPRARLVQKPGEKWSAQEHAGHLLDLESLWMARVDDYLKGATDLTAADLKNRKTHDAGHNDRRIEDILAEFRQARLQLVDRVGGLEAALFAQSLPHPRLRKPIRLVDHLYFAAEHDDHHLARIWELVRETKPASAHV
jgi:hypothetical protein